MEKSTKEKISNLKIPVYNLQGEVVKDISFPKKIYTIKISLALIAQYINSIKKIYFHSIPHLPKDQNFALINDKNFLAKIVDL